MKTSPKPTLPAFPAVLRALDTQAGYIYNGRAGTLFIIVLFRITVDTEGS